MAALPLVSEPTLCDAIACGHSVRRVPVPLVSCARRSFRFPCSVSCPSPTFEHLRNACPACAAFPFLAYRAFSAPVTPGTYCSIPALCGRSSPRVSGPARSCRPLPAAVQSVAARPSRSIAEQTIRFLRGCSDPTVCVPFTTYAAGPVGILSHLRPAIRMQTLRCLPLPDPVHTFTLQPVLCDVWYAWRHESPAAIPLRST